MAIQEQALGETFSNNPLNYMFDWARRTNNLGNMANYYVETRVDGETGRPIWRIRDIADQAANGSTDPSNPAVICLAPNDPLAVIDSQIDG